MVKTLIRKEVRALLPTCTAIAAAVLFVRFMGPRSGTTILALYWIGATGLGALVMGHEYSQRTLSVLLAQPVARGRILAAKLVALAAALALVGIAIWLAMPNLRYREFDPIVVLGWRAWSFPVLSAMCLAPWLTMVGGSATAGLVFATAVPAVFWIGSSVVAAMRFGLQSESAAAANEFRLALLTGTFAVTCVVGVILTAQRFSSLEVTGDRGATAWSPWTRASRPRGSADSPAVTTRPRIALLAAKELRLQALTFVVAGFSVLGWLALWLGRWYNPGYVESLTVPLAIMCGMVISVSAGALASAPEREMGTLESQTLLPISTLTQWAIKLLVAYATTLILAIALPLAGQRFLQPEASYRLRSVGELTAIALAMTSTSLYVSTWCRAGLRALLVSPLVIVTGVSLGGAIAATLRRVGNRAFGADGVEVLHLGPSGELPGVHLVEWLGIASAVILGAVAIRFAATNHVSAERSVRRFRSQTVAIAVVVLCGLAATTTVEALSWGAYFHTGSTAQMAGRWLGAHGGSWGAGRLLAFEANIYRAVYPVHERATSATTVERLIDRTMDDYRRDNVRFLIGTTTEPDRYAADPQRYVRELAAFNALRQQTILRREFRTSAVHPGPSILVLEIPAATGMQ